ncbi:hypothetical protein K449DRAFT_193305 [Hypoxylon sp. EC38]|nr:hypothetical protein K449DRAFT_193305 [Hypoxylon sp. EC38]
MTSVRSSKIGRCRQIVLIFSLHCAVTVPAGPKSTYPEASLIPIRHRDMDCRLCGKNYSQQITDLKCILEKPREGFLETLEYSSAIADRLSLPSDESASRIPPNQPAPCRTGKTMFLVLQVLECEPTKGARWQHDNLI